VLPLDYFKTRWAKHGTIALSIVTLTLLLVWGLRDTKDILNPVTIFATEADLEALYWIEENVPEDAVFLINVTPWQGRIYRGVDGGWWIMPVTGRRTVLPPVLYGQGPFEFVKTINHRAQSISILGETSSEMAAYLTNNSTTHVYIDEGNGSFQRNVLENCECADLVYSQNGVYIFESRFVKSRPLN